MLRGARASVLAPLQYAALATGTGARTQCAASHHLCQRCHVHLSKATAPTHLCSEVVPIQNLGVQAQAIATAVLAAFPAASPRDEMIWEPHLLGHGPMILKASYQASSVTRINKVWALSPCG
ncbi:hypothetical protein BD310DRAFT_936372 [Dichomitus squalens]|uniref:Uncharacterized protein n=1 Tax=Dichomitus squalens TaxID=114155 RepID=A0A4Q9PJJ2_9APHY|nr:hypothetical protein BD310DRAFT_936372 [Dichomitus squalens]